MADTMLTSPRGGQSSCGLTFKTWLWRGPETRLPLSLLKNGGKVWKRSVKIWMKWLLGHYSSIEILWFKTRWQKPTGNWSLCCMFFGKWRRYKAQTPEFWRLWKLEGNATIGGSIIKRRMTQCTPCFKNAVKKRTHKNVLELFSGFSFSMSTKLKCN